MTERPPNPPGTVTVRVVEESRVVIEVDGVERSRDFKGPHGSLLDDVTDATLKALGYVEHNRPWWYVDMSLTVAWYAPGPTMTGESRG